MPYLTLMLSIGCIMGGVVSLRLTKNSPGFSEPG
jgi:hypothetical protein